MYTTHFLVKNILLIYFLNVIFILFFYPILDSQTLSFFIIALFVINLLLGVRYGVVFWCGISYFIYTLNPIAYAIGSSMLLAVLAFKAKGKFRIKEFMMLLVAGISIAVSFIFGINPQILPALLLISNFIVFLLLSVIFNTAIDFKNIIDAFWVGSMIIAGCTLISIYQEGLGDSGRLEFEGSVRELANGLVFPIFVWVTDRLEKKHSSSFPKYIENFCAVLFSTLLLMTLAKGAIFSLAMAIILFALISHRINSKLIIIAIVITALFFVVQLYAGIDFSRFSERNYDLNGRTLIWSFYFDKLSLRGDVGFLLGFGPGNVNRIAPDEYLGHYYAHSTYLDFFFSYGAIGFLLILCLISHIYNRARKAKDCFGQAFLLLIILTFSVTGASTNTQLFVSLYSVYLSSVIKKIPVVPIKKINNLQIDS